MACYIIQPVSVSPSLWPLAVPHTLNYWTPCKWLWQYIGFTWEQLAHNSLQFHVIGAHSSSVSAVLHVLQAIIAAGFQGSARDRRRLCISLFVRCHFIQWMQRSREARGWFTIWHYCANCISDEAKNYGYFLACVCAGSMLGSHWLPFSRHTKPNLYERQMTHWRGEFIRFYKVKCQPNFCWFARDSGSILNDAPACWHKSSWFWSTQR